MRTKDTISTSHLPKSSQSSRIYNINNGLCRGSNKQDWGDRREIGRIPDRAPGAWVPPRPLGLTGRDDPEIAVARLAESWVNTVNTTDAG